MDFQSARILGIGTDLAEVDRIAESIARFGDRFLHRIYTPAEIAYVSSKANFAERYAARFAAKEAAAKALGTGLWSEAGVNWTDIEVTRAESGRPSLVFHQNAAKLTSGLRAHLSLSHTKEHAMAQVVLEDA